MIDARSVDIIDASSLAKSPTVDVEGFELFRYPSAVANLSSTMPEVNTAYREELAIFLKGVFDADLVCVSPRFGIRRQAWKPGEALLKGGAPATFIHSDTSYAFGPDYTRLHSDPPADHKIKRAIVVNMWRLCSAPPTNLPLAVLDFRSLNEADLISATSTVDDRSIELTMWLLKYNPAHRWCYYSAQTQDDLLLFKQWDSDRSHPWAVPHSAFQNEGVGDLAVPRESREARAVLYWFED